MKRQLYVAQSDNMADVRDIINSSLLKISPEQVINVTFECFVSNVIKSGIGYIGQIHYLTEETANGDLKS